MLATQQQRGVLQNHRLEKTSKIRGEPGSPEVIGSNRETPVKYHKGIKGYTSKKRRLCMHLQPRRPTVPWAASPAVWPAGQGRGFCPSAPLW